jgi:ABC-type polar amino acid transport system ATPase subunit
VIFIADGGVAEDNTAEDFFRHPKTERALSFLSRCSTDYVYQI